MKYLKLFEMYDKKGFYEQVEIDEFRELIWDIDSDNEDSYYDSYESKAVDFEESDIKFIKKILDDNFTYSNGMSCDMKVSDIPREPDFPTKSLLISYQGNKPNFDNFFDNFLLIVKLRDEYFAVSWIVHDKHYLCDQLDGLEECLKMLVEYIFDNGR